MAVVEVRNLFKQFGTTIAVDQVSLTIESGEIVSLLGPSGCGKTTTLRCIAGLERPTAGEIVIGSTVVESPSGWVPPEKRNIGLMFQSYALWPHMTVFQNIALGLELRKRTRDEIRERVHRVLDLLQLTGLDKRYPGQLSGGQQQRVALARCIAIEPKVLLFDEPLSNLDAKIRERVRLDLHELLKRLGITSVYVTHDQAEAMAISDRIVVMNRGRIDQQGSARELYERPATRFVADFVGWANFIPVRVAQPGASGELSVLESRDGIRILSDATAVAGDGVVVFRPEHAQVVASGPATTNRDSADSSNSRSAARNRASDGPITGDSDATLGDSSGTASNSRSGAASSHALNTSNGDLPVNTWRARVEKQVYLGSILESHARLGDTLLRVVGVEAPVGSDILLHVPPTRVLFFPEEAAATSGPMDE